MDWKVRGVEIKFKIQNSSRQNKFDADLAESVNVFTTRLDTIFGCTYLVISPENQMIENLKLRIENYDEIIKYVKQAKKKSDLQRTDLAKEKTGIELKGIRAVNPF